MFSLVVLLCLRVSAAAWPDSVAEAASPPPLPSLDSGSVRPSDEAASMAPLGDSLADPLVLPSLPPPSSGRVDSIRILHHGAFEGSKALTKGDSLTYVWADWARDHVLHNRTREETISRRLLFATHDSLDSLRLAETERLLRQERFLADARVRVGRAADGRNLVTVETWDRWSTAVISGFNRAGGEVQWILGLSEANVLGSGRAVSGYYQSTTRRTSWNFGFLDNAFLGQGRLLSLNFSQASDGNSYAARFGRPLNSRYQDVAWMLEFDDAVTDKYVWGDGPLWQQLRREYPAVDASDWPGQASGAGVGRLDSRSLESSSAQPLFTYRAYHTQKARAWVQRVWGDDLRIATGPLVEEQIDRPGDRYVSGDLPDALVADLRASPRWDALREGLPEVEDRRIGWMTTLRRDRWVRKTNFNNLKWVEDIPVGWLLEGTIVRATDSRGDDRHGTWFSASGRWSGVGERTYGTASASWIRRTGGEGPFEDRQGFSWKAEVRRTPARDLQALATASGDLVADAPLTSQVTLGEDNGLPGFPAHSFAGTTRNLFGTELRWTPPLEALTAVPALAAFAGAGRVGDDIRPMGSGEWHYGAGVGIRLGLTRSINGIVNHLSISRPLGPEGGDWNDTRSWMLSFGAKQSL